jgi:hypothetical protein
LKNPPLPQDSSSSDEIDGDYAEFLKTYRPEEFYPPGAIPQDSSSSDDLDEDYVEFLRTYNPQEFLRTWMCLWRVLVMLLISALILYDDPYYLARHCRSLTWRP